MDRNTIQAKLHWGIVAFATISSFFLVGGLTLGGLALVLFAPFPGNLIGGVLVLVGLLIGYFVSGTNRAIELDGETIREKRLFTLGQVNHAVEDIIAIVPLVSGLGGATGAVLDAVIGTDNRGFLLRFANGKKVALIRGDFVGVDEFMRGLKEILGPRWKELGSRK